MKRTAKIQKGNAGVCSLKENFRMKRMVMPDFISRTWARGRLMFARKVHCMLELADWAETECEGTKKRDGFHAKIAVCLTSRRKERVRASARSSQ